MKSDRVQTPSPAMGDCEARITPFGVIARHGIPWRTITPVAKKTKLCQARGVKLRLYIFTLVSNALGGNEGHAPFTATPTIMDAAQSLDERLDVFKDNNGKIVSLEFTPLQINYLIWLLPRQ